MAITNALTIDVEDYFHVSAFESISPRLRWHQSELRVEESTELILRLLHKNQFQATFFILGWVAEKAPRLVKKIAEAGHEVASHGFHHERVTTQSRESFRQDIRRTKALLEDLTGTAVIGYRAPSYSISRNTLWAFDELYEAGHLYDSSIFPIKHDLYGIPDWPRWPGVTTRHADGLWQPGSCQIADDGSSLVEVPITTLRKAGINLPIAGGGYFRLLPYCITRYGLKQINAREQKPFIFYLHPWEFDPDQPKMAGAPLKSRLRHYLNLKQTQSRFEQLLHDFKFAPIREVFANLLQLQEKGCGVNP